MKTNLAPTGQAWLLEPMRSLRRGECSVSGALAQRAQRSALSMAEVVPAQTVWAG